MTDMPAGAHCPRGAAGRVKRRGAGVIRGRDDIIAAGCGVTKEVGNICKKATGVDQSSCRLEFLYLSK